MEKGCAPAHVQMLSLTYIKLLSNGTLATYKIWTQFAQPFARYGNGEYTCARADAPHLWLMQKHKSKLVYKHTPNLNAIGPAPSWSYRRHGASDTLSLGTFLLPWQAPAGIGVGQIRNLLNGDIGQRRPLVNRSTRSRHIIFSRASRGRVGSGRVGSGWARNYYYGNRPVTPTPRKTDGY